VSQRTAVDPEAVSNHPLFGHRIVGVWQNIRCVPISNSGGYQSASGQNVQAGSSRGRGYVLLRMGQDAHDRKAASYQTTKPSDWKKLTKIGNIIKNTTAVLLQSNPIQTQ